MDTDYNDTICNLNSDEVSKHIVVSSDSNNTITIEESEELIKIKQHQKQIKIWFTDVKRKIYDVETSYLEECQLGNIIKGWEIDGPISFKKIRNQQQHEDKERLFSYSSYETYLEHKKKYDIIPSIDVNDSKNNNCISNNNENNKVINTLITSNHVNNTHIKNKKNKKRKSDFIEEWNQFGDY